MLQEGVLLEVEGHPARLRAVLREIGADGVPGPIWWVSALGPESQPIPVESVLHECGRMPLPPYIHREPEDPRSELDLERYQTVYARELGAVAAPTAGLHFTESLLERLEGLGVRRASVTLHVGAGTFLPVQEEDPREHVMHRERFSVPASTAEAIQRCRSQGGRVIAVGTTSVRALESCSRSLRSSRT